MTVTHLVFQILKKDNKYVEDVYKILIHAGNISIPQSL